MIFVHTRKIAAPARRLRNIIRSAFDIINASRYDAWRFLTLSGVFRKTRNESSLGAFITKEYHRIEKGLALPHPRPGFGEKGIQNLCNLMSSALARNMCHRELTFAADSLVSYREFNLAHGVPVQPWLTATLIAVEKSGLKPTDSALKAGQAPRAMVGDGLDLIISRSSVRQFSDEPVPDDVLADAVLAAQHAPCVCNRQAGRIHILRDEKLKALALSFQNGNRGFGDTAPAVAIITVDQAEMLEPNERVQHWIDGGMFAQNFLLGIHSRGYGSCPLNWSVPPSRDLRMRKALGIIPDSETIIMLVAIGALRESYQVARSARRQIPEVANFL